MDSEPLGFKENEISLTVIVAHSILFLELVLVPHILQKQNIAFRMSSLSAAQKDVF